MNGQHKGGKKADRGPERGPERRREIMEAAARLFATRGYRGTSIRDLGEQVGLQGGSLYHHIRSKDALFVELHHAALDAAQARVASAISAHDGPWDRLEAACVAMLKVLLAPDSTALPMMNDFREVPEAVRRQLIARRDAFEALFADLVAALPLGEGVDRRLYRILLLSQLNATADWYRPGAPNSGALSPAEIGRQIARVFRQG